MEKISFERIHILLMQPRNSKTAQSILLFSYSLVRLSLWEKQTFFFFKLLFWRELSIKSANLDTKRHRDYDVTILTVLKSGFSRWWTGLSWISSWNLTEFQTHFNTINQRLWTRSLWHMECRIPKNCRFDSC